MSKALEILQSGRFANEKAAFQAALLAAGFNVKDTEGMNAAQAEIVTKNAMKNVFDRLATIGGQPRVIEIQGLKESGAGVGMQPEANRRILADSIASLDFADKFLADALEERKRLGYRFNESEFVSKWVRNRDNDINKFKENNYDNLALRGAVPVADDGKPDTSKLKVGALYMLEPGMLKDQKEVGKYRYAGDGKFARP
jgi:hypothetical protein